MAFPAVEATSTTGSSAGSTTATLTYPTGIKAGDKLIALLTFDGQPTTTGWPTGWTQKASVVDATNAVRVQVYVKEADGTETGTFNLTVSASEAFIWEMLRVTGAEQGTTIEVATATGSSTNPNPPNLDPTNWATEDTLWIIYAGGDGGTTAFTAGPANYTGNFVARAVTTAANGVTTGLSWRSLNAGSEDPAAFTRATEQWVAVTIAVRTRVANKGRVHWLEFQVPLVDMTDAGTVYVDIQASATEGHEITDSGTVYVDIQPSAVEVYDTRRGRVYWLEFEIPVQTASLTDAGTVGIVITPSGVEGGLADAGTVRVTLTPSGSDAYTPNRRGRIHWLEFEIPLATHEFIDAATVPLLITPSGADVYVSGSTDAGTVRISITASPVSQMFDAVDGTVVPITITPSGVDIKHIEPDPGVRGTLMYFVSEPTEINLDVSTVRLTITPSSVNTLETVDSSTARVTITPQGADVFTREGVDADVVPIHITPSAVDLWAATEAPTVYVDIAPSSVDVFSTQVDAGTVYVTLTPVGVDNYSTAGGTDVGTVYVHITPIAPQEIHFLFDTNLSAIVTRNWSGSVESKRFHANLTARNWSATVNARTRSGVLNMRRLSATTSKKWSATAAR